MDIIAALTLGLLGSMHCIGMCGPLALAVPTTTTHRWKYLLERIVFHSGRAVTYGVMGAVLGFVGKGLMMNLQQDLSIVAGIIMLLSVLIPLTVKTSIGHYSPLQMMYGFVKTRLSVLLKKRGTPALFLMGIVNGLLPCGLVYTALVGATAIGDPWQSALFMIVFGAGTMPALVAVSMTGRLLSVRFRSKLTSAIPVFSIALAVLLILRGLNLGIPLVSPKVTESHEHERTMDCCDEP